MSKTGSTSWPFNAAETIVNECYRRADLYKIGLYDVVSDQRQRIDVGVAIDEETKDYGAKLKNG